MTFDCETMPDTLRRKNMYTPVPLPIGKGEKVRLCLRAYP